MKSVDVYSSHMIEAYFRRFITQHSAGDGPFSTDWPHGHLAIRSWKVDAHSSPSHVFQRSILDSFELFSGHTMIGYCPVTIILSVLHWSQHPPSSSTWMRSAFTCVAKSERQTENSGIWCCFGLPRRFTARELRVSSCDGRPKNCRISHIFSSNDLPIRVWSIRCSKCWLQEVPAEPVDTCARCGSGGIRKRIAFGLVLGVQLCHTHFYGPLQYGRVDLLFLFPDFPSSK